MTLSCGRVGPFMSSFSFDVGHCGLRGGGGGGGGEKSISEHAVNVSGRCMVARQESSALLGCRKKVFENARQMWFLVAHLSSCPLVSSLSMHYQGFSYGGQRVN